MVRSLVEKTRIFVEMIMFKESIFTLPFVYMGSFLALKSHPGWERLGWITSGMLGARALAMTLNRYIDREIDARNPRTADRALPSGTMSTKQCILFGSAAVAVCLISAINLPLLIWIIAPLALALFVFYPYTKRFTWTCHFWLGLTMGFAPLGGWVAVANEFSIDVIPLMVAVACMISGSDIIYTFQDVEVDRSQGLYSVPAVFGKKRALLIARLLHGICFVALWIQGIALDLHDVYFIGIILAASFTVYQSRFVSLNEPSGTKRIFATINSFVSVVVFVFTLSSLLVFNSA